MKLFKKNISLTVFCLVLSLYTLVACHAPFYRHLVGVIEPGLNGSFIVVSMVLLMVAGNFFAYYLILSLGRFVGKCIFAFTLVGDAIMLYFVRNFNVLVTDDMMGNVFNTQYSEASGFFSWALVGYVLVLGVLPCIYLFARKVDYDGAKKALGRIGIALGAVVLLVFGNITNWPWMDRNATQLGSMLMPWSYTVNTFRFFSAERRRNVKEIPLEDPVAISKSRDVCVLIIGESARRDHFSLYGYDRETNAYTVGDSVSVLLANSSATYTVAGVRCILQPRDTKELYEILPNYLYRNGVDVTWRTSNWGEPPVHIEKYWKKADLKAMHPEADERFDGILLAGLKEDILSSTADKVFVVLHTNTSHGPAYNTCYPPEFEKFTPVCETVEMSKASQEEVFNAYDNSILYTDWLIHSVISILREIPDRRCCMLYISDHGESLGENNLYMHGLPMALAPKEQYEIPYLAWTSDPALSVKPEMTLAGRADADTLPAARTNDPAPMEGQFTIYHSVLRFLGIDAPVYEAEKSIF